MTEVLLPSVRDPHCGRASTDAIEISVGRDSWLVPWGRFDAFGSAAYWIDQTVRGEYEARIDGAAEAANVLRETVFCLLGGYGVTAEQATAAYNVVLAVLEDSSAPEVGDIERALRQPLPGGRGRYRFPRQRAERIAAAIAALSSSSPPTDPVGLRDFLRELPGVGPKTAAWIARNVTGSSAVAIIDIWLVRALTPAGIFREVWRVERHYERYEQAFLQYAQHGSVSAGALDLCVWEQARTVGQTYFSAV